MSSERPAPGRRLVIGLWGLVVLAGIALFVHWRWPEPQLEADEDVFNTVDALFTALTSQDVGRLEDCQRRLDSYREEDRLPPGAAKVLDTVIEQAHSGDWEPAARRLYDFMYAQSGG
jgi:hypothetical protein